MSFEPNPQQTLLIFSMLLGQTPEEREPQKSKCKLNAKPRDELTKKKFLACVTREGGKAEYVVLTDRGRHWALENLICRLPERGERPKLVITRLREALGPMIERSRSEIEHRLSIGRVANSSTTENELTLASIQQQVRDAYLSVTNGRLKERVLLTSLRPKVPVVAADFDEAVLALQQQGAVVLMGLDNIAERTPDVESSALHIAGHPRHLVYFQE